MGSLVPDVNQMLMSALLIPVSMEEPALMKSTSLLVLVLQDMKEPHMKQVTMTLNLYL